MPGIYGTSGCPSSVFEILDEAYRDAWSAESCEKRRLEGAAVGGHAFGSRRALYRPGRFQVAVDGEPHAYDATRRWHQGTGQAIFSISDGHLELHPGLRGNVAAFDFGSGTLHLAVEWSGAFPLYYSRWEGGLVFANRLRPLARLTDADVDSLGLLQFLRQGYIFGNRTPFRSVRRLRPGEALRFEPDDGALELRDRSRLWVGDPVPGDEETVRACHHYLSRSLERTTQATEAALMMSGGWDSRTLLAAYGALSDGGSGRLIGYSHGDVESRELDLVRRLCREVGVPCDLEPIDDRVLDLSALRRDYARTGTAIFPHWHRSGHVLRDRGIDCAVAGVFGEIPGGHYGRTMAARGLGKGLALVREWVGAADERPADDPGDVAWSALRLESVVPGEHWYLDPDFERSVPEKRDRINAEIRSALNRLRERGISRSDRLLEACISEHRGSQYIAGQTVSSRTAVDVTVPFADRELLHLVSRIPAGDKVHNAINRAMLESLESDLLDHPMAATLVSASSPMPLQEASRALRKLWETAGWKGYFLSGRRTPAPRLSWVNFEFLRDGTALHHVVDALQADLWDRPALRSLVESVRSGQYGRRLHPVFDQMGKILSADLLLRR